MAVHTGRHRSGSSYSVNIAGDRSDPAEQERIVSLCLRAEAPRLQDLQSHLALRLSLARSPC
jgi:hypothetical protein